MRNDFRIVFMGTPGFAVSSLDALVKSKANVVAVVTAADKPAGRGLKLKESEVKQYAVANNIPVLQPEKLKDPVFLNTLKEFQLDLAVVVAFRMLPETVWTLPKYGTFNLHASLLPQYRGAAPINWAIINGETKTGVTTFFIEREIDSGNIIDKKIVEISQDDTAGTLHDKLAKEGSGLLVETVLAIQNGSCKPIPQQQLTNGEMLNTAPKIFRENCRIDWSKSTFEVYNFIRGLSPYPGAWTILKTGEFQKTLKILECKPVFSKIGNKLIWSDDQNSLNIAGKDGYISIQKLQLEGKKAMNSDEFLRGIRDLKSCSVE